MHYLQRLVWILFVYSGCFNLLAKDETWHLLETPRFTIVSRRNEAATRLWANDFNRFISSLKLAFQTDERFLPPLTVVLFDKDRDFKRYTPLKPNGKKGEYVAGFFSHADTWGVIGLADTYEEDETRRIIFHEGVHWYMSPLPQNLPMCATEGLAEVYSTFEVKKNRVILGNALDGHRALLYQERKLDLGHLLSARHTDALFNSDDHTGVFYAESWALMHYLLFNAEFTKPPINLLLRACDEGLSPDEAVRKATGLSTSELEKRLGDYVTSGSYFIRSYPLKDSAEIQGPFTVARDDQVAIALARLAFGGNHMDLAEQWAQAAIKAAADRPEPYDMLGEIYFNEDKDEQAKATCEKAISLGSRSAETWLALAQEKGIAAIKNNTVPSAAREICFNLEHAINLYPALRPAYTKLAGYVRFLEKVTEDDPKFLEYGRQRFLRDGEIVVGLAWLSKIQGKNDVAGDLLRQALSKSENFTTIRLYALEKLQRQWDSEAGKGSAPNEQAEKAFIAGAAAHSKGDYKSSLVALSEAVLLDPENAAASNELAWVLAVCPEDNVRNGAKAVECAKRACELTQCRNSTYLDTLAAAFAEAGDFGQAVEWESRYLELKISPDDREGALGRLALYRRKKPFREEREKS